MILDTFDMDSFSIGNESMSSKQHGSLALGCYNTFCCLSLKVSTIFKAETRNCTFIKGEDIGKVILTRCTRECVRRDRCYEVSFLPEDGSTKLGICVLLLTSGGLMTQHTNSDAWQHYAMTGRICNG